MSFQSRHHVLVAATLAMGWLASSGALAAPLNLVKSYPDFVLASDQAFSYNATTGTLTITGTVASYTELAGAGGVDNAIVSCGLTGTLSGTNDCVNELDRFSLTAVLNSSGDVLSGSFYLNGLVRWPSATPMYDGFSHSSGHLLSGDLLAFGWAGTSGSSGGIIEFIFNNADGRVATGPWQEIDDGHPAFPGGKMILTISSSTLGVNNFNANALTANWTGSGYGDVVVPLPGAVWLLASGLIGLGGLRARNKAGKQ